MKFLFLRAAAGVLTVYLGATAARAQVFYLTSAGAGLYLRVGIGPSFFQEERLIQFLGPAGNAVKFDTGLAADVALGYAFNRYVAAEFQTGYVGADIHSASGFDSDQSTLYNVPLLGNVTFSLPLPRSYVVPFVGAGAGGAVSGFDTSAFGPFGAGSPTVYGNETDTVLAWQAFAGLRLRLTPWMSFSVAYQYFATQNPTFSYPSAPPGGPNLNVGFDGPQTHSVMFLFQWRFW